MSMGTGDISERAQVLLKALVERHIRDGQPVGSSTLASEAGLPVSAATVRNVMSDLEELGYLQRAPDPQDGRQVSLGVTAEGVRLMQDSIASTVGLDRHFLELLGDSR